MADLDVLLASEARDAEIIDAYEQQSNLLFHTARAQPPDEAALRILCKVAAYKNLVRLNVHAASSELESAVAAAAFRDSQLIQFHEFTGTRKFEPRVEPSLKEARKLRIPLPPPAHARALDTLDTEASAETEETAEGNPERGQHEHEQEKEQEQEQKRKRKRRSSLIRMNDNVKDDGDENGGGVLPTTHWAARNKAPYVRPNTSSSVFGDLVHACYVCRIKFPRALCFGDWRRADGGHANLCGSCGYKNFCALRAIKNAAQKAVLQHWTVLITGCRHTIGFAATLLLLRAGARVIGTTRFPRAALASFCTQPDFSAWSERLTLLELDMTQAAHIAACTAFMETLALDAFINNAFLTVHQTDAYYARLRALEGAAKKLLDPVRVAALANANANENEDAGPNGEQEQELKEQEPEHKPNLLQLQILNIDASASAPSAGAVSSAVSSGPPPHCASLPLPLPLPLVLDEARMRALPASLVCEMSVLVRAHTNEHANLDEPVNRSTMWTEHVQDASVAAILETTVVNQVAPTALVRAACKAMDANAASRRVLINVTSTEHLHTTPSHAITGMQKAAMEALWFKLAQERRPEQRFTSVSVDPGFVTGVVDLGAKRGFARSHHARKPLTSEDGGARVVHPIFSVALGRAPFRDAYVLKNYGPARNMFARIDERPFAFTLA